MPTASGRRGIRVKTLGAGRYASFRDLIVATAPARERVEATDAVDEPTQFAELERPHARRDGSRRRRADRPDGATSGSSRSMRDRHRPAVERQVTQSAIRSLGTRRRRRHCDPGTSRHRPGRAHPHGHIARCGITSRRRAATGASSPTRRREWRSAASGAATRASGRRGRTSPPAPAGSTREMRRQRSIEPVAEALRDPDSRRRRDGSCRAASYRFRTILGSSPRRSPPRRSGHAFPGAHGRLASRRHRRGHRDRDAHRARRERLGAASRPCADARPAVGDALWRSSPRTRRRGDRRPRLAPSGAGDAIEPRSTFGLHLAGIDALEPWHAEATERWRAIIGRGRHRDARSRPARDGGPAPARAPRLADARRRSAASTACGTCATRPNRAASCSGRPRRTSTSCAWLDPVRDGQIIDRGHRRCEPRGRSASRRRRSEGQPASTAILSRRERDRASTPPARISEALRDHAWTMWSLRPGDPERDPERGGPDHRAASWI